VTSENQAGGGMASARGALTHETPAGEGASRETPRLLWIAAFAVLGAVAFGFVRLGLTDIFDRPIAVALNHLTWRWRLFDAVVSELDGLAMVKGVALYSLVFAAFTKADFNDRTRLVLGCFGAAAAAALSRVAQLAMPHNPRPLFDTAISFKAPYGLSSIDLADWSSFPSDHAALLFGVAGTVMLVNRRLGLLAFGLVTLAALARMYTGLHYASDTLGGLLWGCACALAASTLPVARWAPLPRLVERHRGLFAAAGFFLAVESAYLFVDVRVVGSGLMSILR